MAECENELCTAATGAVGSTPEDFWADPAPTQRMNDYLDHLRRLSRASVAQYSDSESGIDWSLAGGGRLLKSEESLGLYGTPYWELLDETQRRRLAWLEVVHTWYSFVAIETFAVTLQSSIVLREYTAKAQGIPEEVTEYWIHFCKEELVHTLMFRRALKHFQSPAFPDEVSRARLIFGGLNWVSTIALALMFEWYQEELQWKTSAGDDIDPIARQVVRSHHVEESRHIRFGREVVAACWGSQSAEEREKVLPLLVAAIRISIDDLTLHRDVLRAMQLTRPEFANPEEVIARVLDSEYRVELNRTLYRRIFGFLRDVGIYDRTTAPVFETGGIARYFTH